MQVIYAPTGDTPSAIWSDILWDDPATELTEKQVYVRWILANTGKWRLADCQVESPVKVSQQWMATSSMFSTYGKNPVSRLSPSLSGKW
jgi:hypothetical protein